MALAPWWLTSLVVRVVLGERWCVRVVMEGVGVPGLGGLMLVVCC